MIYTDAQAVLVVILLAAITIGIFALGKTAADVRDEMRLQTCLMRTVPESDSSDLFWKFDDSDRSCRR